MKSEIEDVAREIAREQALIQRVLDAMASVIVGQQYLMERILVALLCNGHILIEGVPGLAKTKVVKSLAQLIHARFQRIQFTPDLLPADLIGTLIYNPHEGVFTTRKGPIFANIVLADEINRAPAKVHSALLEAMRSARSPSARSPISWRTLSWSWLPRTPSSRRAPTRCRKPRWTGSCSRSSSPTRHGKRSARSCAAPGMSPGTVCWGR